MKEKKKLELGSKKSSSDANQTKSETKRLLPRKSKKFAESTSSPGIKVVVLKTWKTYLTCFIVLSGQRMEKKIHTVLGRESCRSRLVGLFLRKGGGATDAICFEEASSGSAHYVSIFPSHI